MERRSFFGALIGLVMAPFAVKAAKSEPDVTVNGIAIDWIDATNFQPPMKWDGQLFYPDVEFAKDWGDRGH